MASKSQSRWRADAPHQPAQDSYPLGTVMNSSQLIKNGSTAAWGSCPSVAAPLEDKAVLLFRALRHELCWVLAMTRTCQWKRSPFPHRRVSEPGVARNPPLPNVKIICQQPSGGEGA
jgi:hypothetical protein